MNTAEIAAIIDRWKLNGLVIGTLRNGAISCQVFGVRDLETREAVTEETIFGIGSISKVFTATLAMRLVDAGKLDLDAPIVSYYPQLALSDAAAREALTMRHLLTHRGGFEGDGFEETGIDDDSLPRFVADFAKHPQFTAPGEIWSYSNNGFGLAGAVAAHAAGTTYEDAMRQYVFTPLGLTRSGFSQPPALENTATGYDFDSESKPTPKDPVGVTRSANPAGGLLSTVPDLLRFGQAHLGQLGTFLTESTRQEMQRTQATVSSVETWGIGWGKKLVRPGVWAIEHGGWMNGFRAQLTLLPETGEAFAILTNSPLGHAAIEDLQELLLDDLLGAAPDEATFDAPASIEEYLGRYLQSHMDVEFIAADDAPGFALRLKTKWHGENAEPMLCPLRATAPDEFEHVGGEFVGSRVSFIRNAQGEIIFARVLNRVCLAQVSGA
jgi:CubicO group peptidase (beta-lactamase class C family)